MDRARLLWSHQTGGEVSSGAALAGRVVYIGSDDGHVYALDAATGHRIRTFRLGSAVTVGGHGGPGRPVRRHRRRDGARAARHRGRPLLDIRDRPPGRGVARGGAAAWSTSATTTTTSTRSTRAAERLKWRYQTGGPVRRARCPASCPYDDKVYAGSDDGHVYALDTQTGELQWRYALRGPVSSGLAQAAPARVYAGDEHGNLYGLDAGTGADPLSNWRRRWAARSAVRWRSQQDTVYAGSADGSVHAVNIYGDPLWSYPAGSPVNSGLAVSGGTLYAGSDDGYLHAIDVSTGKRRVAVPDRRRGALADPGGRPRGLLRQPRPPGVRGARLSRDRGPPDAQSPASQAFQPALTLAELRKTNLPASGSLPGASTLPNGLAYLVYISMAEANIWFIPYLASMYA